MPRPRRPPLLDHYDEGSTAELEVTAFNPLHPKPLGESVARALEAQPVHPLPPALPFNGAGVYAIYYYGDSPYYRGIAAENRAGNTQPIYFGKADPRGGRKGVFVEAPGRVLYNRLKSDHADSIAEVEANTVPSDPGYLRLEDFRCRFLVVEPVWIPLIESLSITTFQPVWNGLLDGFGHHDQGSTRRTQKRSFWDTLHPGRQWATRFAPNPLGPEMLGRVLDVWLSNPKVKLPTRPRNATPEILAEIFAAWVLDPVRFRTARWLRERGGKYATLPLELEPEEEGVVALDDGDDDDSDD